MNRKLCTKIFTIGIALYSQVLLANPLSNEEKLSFIRGSVPPCISKNIIAHNTTSSDDKRLIENYCTCHASTMASIVTREEMISVNKGSIPKSFESKILQARQQCIQQIKK
jgi:hypothetical protein